MNAQGISTDTTVLPSVGSSNDVNDLSALSIRLDTRPLLDDVELWLRGSRIVTKNDEHGNIVYENIKFGKAKVNEIGIQSILGLASTVLNSQFVQGNWKEQRYEDFVAEFHDSLMWSTWINLYDWGIDENDYEGVVDHIMHCVIGFASRLINNKERDSYKDTVRTIETSQIRDRGGGFSLFGKKN